MPTEEERSFAQAMNEWSAKQSTFHNTGNRLIHPDPSLPLPFRIFGYLFRLAVVLLLLYLVFVFLVGRHLKGEGFAEMMAEKVGTKLAAADYEGYAYSWKGDRAYTKIYRATGSEDSFFRSLEANAVKFRIARPRMFSKAWELDTISIGTLKAELRVGRSESISLISPESQLSYAGFGINPDLDQLTFEAIEVDKANLNWGIGEQTKGRLSDAQLTFRRTESGSKLQIVDAVLQQNWLKDLQVATLDIAVQSSKVSLTDGLLGFEFPGKNAEGKTVNGQARLTGEISIAAVPDVNLQIALKDTAIENFLPNEFRRYVTGNTNGMIAIGGSPNAQTGITTNGTLVLNTGRLRNIAALQALSLLLEKTSLRQLPITNGIIEFSTGENQLTVPKFELQSDGGTILRGRFTVRAAKQSNPTIELPPIDLPDIPTEDDILSPPARQTGSAIEQWLIDGSAELGVSRELVESGHPSSKDIFSTEKEGLLWVELPLAGKISEITADLQQRIIDSIQNHDRGPK